MEVTIRIVYKAFRRILAMGELPFWPYAGKTCAVLRSLVNTGIGTSRTKNEDKV